MTYFIVLPLVLAWLFVIFVTSVALRIKWPEWRGRRYFFHASLWSSIGIFAANALLLVGLWFGLRFINGTGDSDGFIHNLVRIFWGASAILGPLFVSAVGWGIGILVGLVIAHRRNNALA